MNHSEKKILIIGGSILGGLTLMFGLYKKFKPNFDNVENLLTKQKNAIIPDNESDDDALQRTAEDMRNMRNGGKNKKSRKLRKRHTKSK